MEELNHLDRKGFISVERLIHGPWQAFERSIARLLCHKGWELYDVVGGSGDHGADVLASYKDENGEFVDYVIQAKFSERNRPLSVDIVGDVKRAMEYYGISRGICVSNRLLGDNQAHKLKILCEQGFEISKLLSRNILQSYEALPEWVEEDRTLKPFQQEAIQELVNSYNRGNRAGMICLATGLGKTFVAATFLRWIFEMNPEFNVLILANSKALIEQFDRAIWTNLPKWKATHLVYDSEKPAFFEGVTLCTFQSFPEFQKRSKGIKYDIIIVDEAHHAPARTYESVIRQLEPRYLLGLTATPFRMDAKSVEKIFGPPLVYYSVYKALSKGYLSKVDYNIMNDNMDGSWISLNSSKGYTIKQLNKKVFIPERDEAICDRIIETWEKNKLDRGIVFCNSSEHAERIEKILRVSYSFPARSLTTRIKQAKERARRLREFKKGEIKIISCYDMLNEGIDVPDVDYIAFLRVTHSRVYFLQQLGRGLRYKEKKTLIVHDYVADIRRVKEVKLFGDEYENIRANEIEELKLGDSFKVKFSNNIDKNFLDLVSRDISEEMDEDELIYLP